MRTVGAKPHLSRASLVPNRHLRRKNHGIKKRHSINLSMDDQSMLVDLQRVGQLRLLLLLRQAVPQALSEALRPPTLAKAAGAPEVGQRGRGSVRASEAADVAPDHGQHGHSRQSGHGRQGNEVILYGQTCDATSAKKWPAFNPRRLGGKGPFCSVYSSLLRLSTLQSAFVPLQPVSVRWRPQGHLCQRGGAERRPLRQAEAAALAQKASQPGYLLEGQNVTALH